VCIVFIWNEKACFGYWVILYSLSPDAVPEYPMKGYVRGKAYCLSLGRNLPSTFVQKKENKLRTVSAHNKLFCTTLFV
jgi:hypothetical protein